MKPIITVKNIGKKYLLNHQKANYVALRDVLTTVFKNPFASLKTKEVFWALQELNFEVMQGEVIGIIGKNGAGKSTLLKILSQITPPTTGEIRINGTVGSLLEVGTGFHPELTGRENIFLNGAILGMKKQEIAKKFEQIVAFAGIEQFLDTPVKYYSSGMYVRLAFSVAAHIETDILIIDEVLAVGDAEFQKKCLAKMGEITKQDGRTILFVSHNLLAVKQLCTRSILLVRGKIQAVGNTEDIIPLYLNDKSVSSSSTQIQLATNRNAGDVRFTTIGITTADGSDAIQSHDKLLLTLSYTSAFQDVLSDARIVITVTSALSKHIVLRLDSNVSSKLGETLKPEGVIICETEVINLIEGTYSVDVDFLIQGTSCDYIKHAAEFTVTTNSTKYDYKIPPDNTVCDHVIGYTFKQKS